MDKTSIEEIIESSVQNAVKEHIKTAINKEINEHDAKLKSLIEKKITALFGSFTEEYPRKSAPNATTANIGLPVALAPGEVCEHCGNVSQFIFEEWMNAEIEKEIGKDFNIEPHVAIFPLRINGDDAGGYSGPCIVRPDPAKSSEYKKYLETPVDKTPEFEEEEDFIPGEDHYLTGKEFKDGEKKFNSKTTESNKNRPVRPISVSHLKMRANGLMRYKNNTVEEEPKYNQAYNTGAKPEYDDQEDDIKIHQISQLLKRRVDSFPQPQELPQKSQPEYNQVAKAEPLTQEHPVNLDYDNWDSHMMEEYQNLAVGVEPVRREYIVIDSVGSPKCAENTTYDGNTEITGCVSDTSKTITESNKNSNPQIHILSSIPIGKENEDEFMYVVGDFDIKSKKYIGSYKTTKKSCSCEDYSNQISPESTNPHICRHLAYLWTNGFYS